MRCRFFGLFGRGEDYYIPWDCVQRFGEDIILIDPSKGCIDFTQWAKPKALAFVGLYQLRETEAVISWAREEMAERVRINNKYGVGNIFELDPDDVEEADRSHLKPLNILFDEFNSYLQETGKTTQNPQKDMQIANDNAAVSATNASIARTMSALSKIIVQGRTAGIRCIFGAQRLTMDDMKKYNGNAFFRSLGRVLLGMDSPAGVVSAQNLSEANRTQKSLKNEEGLIPVGRGIYESMQGTLMAVQTWYSGGHSESGTHRLPAVHAASGGTVHEARRGGHQGNLHFQQRFRKRRGRGRGGRGMVIIPLFRLVFSNNPKGGEFQKNVVHSR